MSSRIIIFSAPSGSGKSSIIKELLKEEDLNLAFSISTTSRIPRGKEQNGVEYYFISVDEFKEKIDKACFPKIFLRLIPPKTSKSKTIFFPREDNLSISD